MGSVAKNSRSNGSSRRRPGTAGRQRFVVCVRNTEYPVSLELRKLYRVLEDPDAARHKHLRVVDESGEDYLYPANCFLLVELPEAVRRALLKAS